MLLQAILLGLVAMLGNAEYLFGTSLLSRPLVMGTLTGIVLGDVQTGVTLGATLELAFMGAFSIGASIPPEMISGTVLGTAFTITTGAGPETALTVGLPVASLVLIAKNVGMVFILPPFVHKADKYAAEGNMAGVARMHLLGGFFGVNLIIGVIVACGYYAGGPAVQALLNVIPKWISNGLQITMGLLPAIGFGLLLMMEFFNTTPQLATLILGISAAMEESNANDPEFDTESINSVKVSLMGPLAGIGDSFIWGTLRIIATGVGLSLANQGNILGPILFLLIFNLPAQGLRYYLMNTGYKLGSGFLAKIQQNGLMSKLTYAASVLGLMVVGGMTAENVSISFPLKFGSGNEATTLNDVFNNIMPGLMPLLFTLLVYYLLKKKNVKTTTLLLICVVIGLVGAFFGILGC